MKKVAIVGAYLSACFLGFVVPYETAQGFSDAVDLLFLNSQTFEKHHISKPSIFHMGMLALFVYLLIYLLYQSANEFVSYNQMKLYRMSKRQVMGLSVVRILKDCWVIYAVSFVTVTAMARFVLGFEITREGAAVFALYLLRLMLLFYVITLIYDTGSFIGAHTKVSFLGPAIALGAIVIDETVGLKVITFSNNLQTELWGVGIWLVLTCAVTGLCFSIFQKKGDIL